MIDVPENPLIMDDEAEDEFDDYDEDENKDVRYTEHRRDKMIIDDDGLVSDSDNEEEDNIARRVSTRRNIADHGTPIITPGDDVKEPTATTKEITDSLVPDPSELMDLYGDTMIVDVPHMPHDEAPRYTLLQSGSA